MCHFVFDYNSGFSWSIYIFFVPVELSEYSTKELTKFTTVP